MHSESTAKPPRWKSIAVSFSVVYPTLSALTHLVAPQLSWLPQWLRDAALVILMCTVLSYAIPAMTRLLRGWLRP